MAEKCSVCNNPKEWLTGRNGEAYFICLADIGQTWFQDYGDGCLAAALLAETGHGRPALRRSPRRFSLVGITFA